MRGVRVRLPLIDSSAWGHMLDRQLLCHQHAHALWCSREHVSETDTEEKRLLNKVDILFFGAQKEFSSLLKMF